MATVDGTLSEVLTADGSTTDVLRLTQGIGLLEILGDIGGGDLTMEVSFDGEVTWHGVKDQSGSVKTFTSVPDYNEFSFGGVPCKLRATLANSTAPNLTVRIYS